MFVRARRVAVACLLVAGCAGSDGSGGEYHGNENPSTGDGDRGDGDGDSGDGDADNGDGDDDGPTMADPDGDPADACQNGSEALAQGISIREISLYQVVKIPLYANGEWLTTRVAPVVQNKKSLMRVFVDTDASFTSHAMRAVLTLDNGGTPKWIVDKGTPKGSSVETDAGSTFNFQIDASDITTSTRFSVALVENTCPDELGSASQARFPASGAKELQARAFGKLRVQLVPVQLDNGIVPTTSEGQIEQIRNEFLAYYPVSEVEVTAHAPMQSDLNPGPSGQNWGELLQDILLLRLQDGAPDDLYYYGLIMPEATIDNFCDAGCVLGLAMTEGESDLDPRRRGALGIGYEHPETYTTVVHEVAHAHGRLHAPCAPGGQIAGVDSSYPNDTADTGDWGWDSRSNALKPPTSKDFMSYCRPTWISAYSYAALARRSNMINKSLKFSDTEWSNLLIPASGRARWSQGTTFHTPLGPSETAFVKDAAGNTLKQIQVVRTPLADMDGAFVSLPTPEANWATISLHDRDIQLRDVRPASQGLRPVSTK